MADDPITDFSFEEEEVIEFNPLAEFDFADDIDEDDEVLPSTLDEGPYGMPNPDVVTAYQHNLVSFANGETAEERIDALFTQMPTMQRILYQILGMVTEPLSTEQLDTQVEKLKEHHHSIYSPLTLIGLLERAGAIAKTDASGASLEEVEQEPILVELDGVEYWTVAPAPEVFWTVSPEGNAKLVSYKPLELIAACYEAEPEYAPIFTTVLELTAHPGGSSLRDIGNIVDDEPVLQSPRRYAMYFIDKLEHAGAVTWQGSWTITDAGREFLTALESADQAQSQE